ncbi:MAG: hypothetical protein V8Q43_02400 [Christensenellaceae bacterium]
MCNPAEDLQKALRHNELFVDIGAESRRGDALKYVKVGDHICFDTQCSYFGDDIMKAKALDDRVGCAMALELLKTAMIAILCRVHGARGGWRARRGGGGLQGAAGFGADP